MTKNALGSIFPLLLIVPALAAASDSNDSPRSRCLAKVDREAQYVERRLALLESSAEGRQVMHVGLPFSQRGSLASYVGNTNDVDLSRSASIMSIEVSPESVSLLAQRKAFARRREECNRLPDTDDPRLVISRGSALRRQGT